MLLHNVTATSVPALLRGCVAVLRVVDVQLCGPADPHWLLCPPLRDLLGLHR